MKFLRFLTLAVSISAGCFADTPAKPLNGFPFQDEALRFSVNWPTGVSLGRAFMQARRIEGGRWEFELTLQAEVPGVIAIKDRYRSVATADLCSVEFERESEHGTRKARETVTFAQDRNMAHRETKSGGASDFRVPDCAKDALTFLYFTRREMGQGRVPPASTIALGGPYEIRLDYRGAETYNSGPTDRLDSTVRGPASNVSFDVLFARDPARTPLLIRTPLPLGTFSLELSR